MKITAGFHSCSDYLSYCQNGADELFCGYMPGSWQERFGIHAPINRREVLCSNVQLGGENELRILSSMMQDTGIPVVIAINYYTFTDEQIKYLLDYIDHCHSMGFSRFILADPALLFSIYQSGLHTENEFQISGDFGEINLPLLTQLHSMGIRRLIYHRHVSPQQMRLCFDLFPDLEYEAFLLNEKCHFHGAYCQSLHCDELPPLCRIPYQISSVTKSNPDSISYPLKEYSGDSFGSGGCGICALWQLQDAGVQYVKIVGRGAHTDQILRDIQRTRIALDILQNSASEIQFKQTIQKDLFPNGCSLQCYYPE